MCRSLVIAFLVLAGCSARPARETPGSCRAVATPAQLAVTGTACGGTVCGPGLYCCNPSCSMCAPKNAQCPQIACN